MLSRKRTLFLLLLFTSAVQITYAQQIDSLTLSKLKLNFVVPDMPAFQSLGTEPSKLLKPSTPMALAVTISDIFSDRQFVVPKAFAVELSPSLLLNAKKGPIGLKEYAKNKVGNSFRISLGTSLDSVQKSSARNMALGFRISIINDGDPSTDLAYQDSISKLLREFINDVSTKTLVNFALIKRIDTALVDWENMIMGNKVLKAEFNTYLARDDENSQASFLVKLKRLREDYKKRHWNDNKLDAALAIVSTSTDSLFKNIRYNRAEFWLTGAFKSGKNAQFLIGLNGQNVKNLADTTSKKGETNFNLSVPARFLIGTNRVKGFAEAQYSYVGDFKHHKYLFNLGAEFNLVDGIWLNVSGGFDQNATLKISKLLANFNLKLTLPEKYNFF